MSQIKQLQPKEGVTIIPVRVPENGSHFKVLGFDYLHCLIDYVEGDMHPDTWCIRLPEGNWQLLGKATEIPEEVWQGIVEEITFGKNTIPMYRNYKYPMPQCTLARKTATESAMSLLASHEVYSVNPFGERPSIINHDVWYSEEEWQQAEANTGKWVFLMKQND